MALIEDSNLVINEEVSRGSHVNEAEEISLMFAGSPPPVPASPPTTPESCSAESSSAVDEGRRRRVQLADSLAASYPSASLSRALRDVPGAEALRDSASVAVALKSSSALTAAGAASATMSVDQGQLLSRSCYASLRGSPEGGGGGGDDSELADFDWLVSLRPSPAGLLCCEPIDAESPPLLTTNQHSARNRKSSLSISSNIFRNGSAAADDDDEEAGYLGEPSPLCATLRALSGDYDPQADRLMKPPYSFSCLIFMALEASPEKCLPVKKIYQWIEDNFPYYRHANNGWKNSVRHNLSLNKSFTKVFRDVVGDSDSAAEEDEVSIKGSLWTVDPMARAGMLQALKKTPYHPFAQVQMYCTAGTLYKTGASGARERQHQQQQQQQIQLLGSGGTPAAPTTASVPAGTLGRLRYSGLLGTALLAAAAAAATAGGASGGGVGSTDDSSDVATGAATVDDDSPSTPPSTPAGMAKPATPPLHHYHPNVNSFRGGGSQVTRIKSESVDLSAPNTSGAIKDSTDDDAVASGGDKQQRLPRKQDLVPSAHLYPFLAAKMRRLVHILGDQATDPDCLQRADNSLADDEDDEEEDGYIEVEQPVKRPRGRPRKDSAPIYRPLPLAKAAAAANRRKKARRLGGKSSGMPSVNELVAAAQMTQMKREAAAAAAAAAVSKPPKLEPAPTPASKSTPIPLPLSPSRLQDAQALCLVYKRASEEAAAAAASAETDPAAAEDGPTEAKLPRLIGASGSGLRVESPVAVSATDNDDSSSSALVRLALNPSALRVPCGPVSPTNSEPDVPQQQQQQQQHCLSKTHTIGGARIRVLPASDVQPHQLAPTLFRKQQQLQQPPQQLLLQPLLSTMTLPDGIRAAPAVAGTAYSHFIIKLAGNR